MRLVRARLLADSTWYRFERADPTRLVSDAPHRERWYKRLGCAAVSHSRPETERRAEVKSEEKPWDADSAVPSQSELPPPARGLHPLDRCRPPVTASWVSRIYGSVLETGAAS
jgi:hypothetical protein